MNAQITRRVLAGEERGAYRDAAALNAAAAIVAAGKAKTVEEGLERAYASIDTGAALAKLHLLIDDSSRIPYKSHAETQRAQRGQEKK